MAVVANLFVELANGTKRIVDVVYAPNGTCLASYFKHHLFATELTTFTRGPFHPTTFSLGGATFGLVICYEGVYPDLTGDWKQMEGLVAASLAKSFRKSVVCTVKNIRQMELETDPAQAESQAQAIALAAFPLDEARSDLTTRAARTLPFVFVGGALQEMEFLRSLIDDASVKTTD